MPNSVVAECVSSFSRPEVGPHGSSVADVDVVTDVVDGVTVVGQVFVGRGPIVDMSVSSHSGMVFVTNQTDNSVSQLDFDTFAVVATVTGTNEPFVVKTAGSRAFVSTASDAYDAVTVIDTEAGGVVATIPLAASIRDLALSPDGCHIYVARTTGDGADLAVIDTISGAVTAIDLGTRRGSTAAVITISRDGAWVYVVTADHLGSELVAIDTRDDRVAGRSALAAPIRGIAVSADGGTVFVAGDGAEMGSHVDVLDARTHRVVSTLAVHGSVRQLLSGLGGDFVYVVNGMQIAVVCTVTREIVDTVFLLAEPASIGESRDGKSIFVADYDGWVTAYSVESAPRHSKQW